MFFLINFYMLADASVKKMLNSFMASRAFIKLTCEDRFYCQDNVRNMSFVTIIVF